MGQSLMKFSPGNEEKKMKQIADIVENSYTKHFIKASNDNKNTLTYFYRAVCETVEEINKTFGYTQFRVPSAANLQIKYDAHHKQPEKAAAAEDSVARNEFEAILREILITDAGVTGVGVKDTLIYIFGVPIAALLVKQSLFPRVVPRELFIPAVTSATVFALAKLNKI